ncbi:MAG: C4-dicarboxylic acid transporter DauA [Phycisphaeraceae bacterium]
MAPQSDSRGDGSTDSYLKPAAALRESLSSGYTGSDLKSDILAGLVVGIVAVPLSMALAVASGVPPQHGLYTAIVAGGLIALLGGSRVQVSGPTAAFVVILVPVAARFGLAGLALATFMAGMIQITMGLTRMGRLIQYIPYPVTTGFTAGIAVVIATLQLKDFLGLTVEPTGHHFIERVIALFRAVATVSWANLAVGAFALAILVLWPRFNKKIPAPLVALTLAALLAAGIEQAFPATDGSTRIATVQSRFASQGNPHGIPQAPPTPGLPWRFHGPDDPPFELSLDTLQALLPAAFAIAILGAIESLLSAVVADGMTGHQHNPDSELLAQGVGNVVGPFFGAIAATGAIARTAANVRFGARSPIAALTHSAFLLVTLLALAPLLGYLPMAGLAALLMRVAWHMSEAKHFVHTLRIAPRSDTFVLLTCFALTVVFDMVIAVGVGVTLAAMLFMRRMADVADTRMATHEHHALTEPLPPGVLLYEIAGPMFFGAAQKAMSSLLQIGNGVRIIILDLRSVPVMDITGLVNLQSALDRLAKLHVLVILAGVQKQPMQVIAKAHLRKDRHFLSVCGTIEQGIESARTMAMLLDEPGEASHRPGV